MKQKIHGFNYRMKDPQDGANALIMCIRHEMAKAGVQEYQRRAGELTIALVNEFIPRLMAEVKILRAARDSGDMQAEEDADSQYLAIFATAIGTMLTQIGFCFGFEHDPGTCPGCDERRAELVARTAAAAVRAAFAQLELSPSGMPEPQPETTQ